jgi:hypothetical protein
MCSNTPNNANCDDAAFCNGAESCDALLDCVAGVVPCDDQVACTDDPCDEAADSCLAPAPNDAFCDDMLFCTGFESCDPLIGDLLTGCAPDASPACDDGIGCTNDVCDEATDSCSAPPDNNACDDAVFCNGVETCDPTNGDPTSGCLAAPTPACDDGIDCTVDSCDEVNTTCSNVPTPALCDDGLFCTGSEFCDVMNGQCATTGAEDCNDNVACTADFCDGGTDQCAHVAQNAVCNDGLFCNGAETCHVLNDCQPGTPPVCDDGVPCTIDACDEQNDTCAVTPDNGACDDSVFCNGAEQCVAGVGCQSGAPPVCEDGLDCTSNSCDPGTDACAFAPNDVFCDDGTFCNGNESCDVNAVPGSGCVAGSNVACVDDGIACTVESCDEMAMGCVSTADNSLCNANEFCVPALNGCVPSAPCNNNVECDDGNDCNGIETCNVVCQAGMPVNCNDGVPCTIDSCDPNGGTCTNLPNDGACDDGFACNGTESCDAMNGCQAGVAVNCDDSVGCTLDSCNEPSGTCSHVASNAACSDGVFCNGPEVCNVANGCQAGTPPSCADSLACTVDSCDFMLDACTHQPDNSLCLCGETCNADGCGNNCVVTKCQGKVYQCGDCLDNDADCGIDVGGDDMCFGPCDNNEAGLKGNIPGQNSAPCKQDCYFDGDTGAGNDDCFWSHKCDPNEVAPDFYPEGPACAYDPNANIPGSNQSCAQLQVSQSQICLDFCGPLTPNGCDCFGCCDVPGAPTPIWLGSVDGNGDGSCTLADIADPTKCHPCQIVSGCFNTCDNCEICLGKPTLPPECLCQECPPGAQLCGAPCGTPCSPLEFCNNGCCVGAP